MNKFLVILTALLLSGCAAKVSQLQTPEKIEYNGKTYKLTASQDLDTIARYVYIAEPETLENWKSQIEVLLDRDVGRSIEQRVALREKVYRNLGVQDFKIRANSTNPKKPATELNGLCHLCTNRTKSVLAGGYCEREKYFPLWFCAIPIFPKSGNEKVSALKQSKNCEKFTKVSCRKRK